MEGLTDYEEASDRTHRGAARVARHGVMHLFRQLHK